MREQKISKIAEKVIIILLTAILAASIIIYYVGQDSYTPINYETIGFANMRGADGHVYKGIGGAYGEDIPVKASTFAIRDGKIYYAEQIKKDYEISDERFGSIYVADMPNGKNSTELTNIAYNVGYGQERLIGDKIFYTTGYDEDYNFMYAWVNVEDGTMDTISSRRINNIIGYDGTYLFYSGFDKKKSQNIVGKYNLETQKDKTLFSYGDSGEIGSIIGISFSKGAIYAVTMTKQPENYDDRTAEYAVNVYDSKKGKLVSTLPFVLTGAANYGFLFDNDILYYSTADSICKISLVNGATEGTVLCNLGELDYWGIPHFAPGDDYLYFETLADLDPDTGFNDYFHRVDINGGEPETLTAWFIN